MKITWVTAWPFYSIPERPHENYLDEYHFGTYDAQLLTNLGTKKLFDESSNGRNKSRNSRCWTKGVRFRRIDGKADATEKSFGNVFCNILRDELTNVINHRGCNLTMVTFAVVYRLTHSHVLEKEYEKYNSFYTRPSITDFRRFLRHDLNILQSSLWVQLLLRSAGQDEETVNDITLQYISACTKYSNVEREKMSRHGLRMTKETTVYRPYVTWKDIDEFGKYCVLLRLTYIYT